MNMCALTTVANMFSSSTFTGFWALWDNITTVIIVILLKKIYIILISCCVEKYIEIKDCSLIHGLLHVLMQNVSYYKLTVRSHLRLHYIKSYYIR
jgi:hypothetical protein